MELGYQISTEIQEDGSAASYLLCIICSKISYLPKIINCCENMMCSNCIETWLSKSNSCPLCRMTNPGLNIPNKFIMRMFDNLKYKCPNENKGCNSIISYKEYENHIKSCKFQEKNPFCSSCHTDIPLLSNKIKDLVTKNENLNKNQEKNKKEIAELKANLSNLFAKIESLKSRASSLKPNFSKVIDIEEESKINSIIFQRKPTKNEQFQFHDHLTQLIKKPFLFSCDACGKKFNNEFSNNCKSCNLDLCVPCFETALKKINPNKNKHHHELTINVRKRLSVTCDICKSFKGKLLGFYCSPCNFDICWSCYWK